MSNGLRRRADVKVSVTDLEIGQEFLSATDRLFVVVDKPDYVKHVLPVKNLETHEADEISLNAWVRLVEKV